MRFALNQIVAPRLAPDKFFALALSLGVDIVEIRHGLTGAPIVDDIPAQEIRKMADGEGVTIISISALYPFNSWDETVAARAEVLADYAAEAGAAGIALYPRNDGTAVAHSQVVAALEALAPILRARSLKGHVEPFGLPGSSMRSKGEAISAIEEAAGWDIFDLLHDTFQHYVASDEEIYPRRTGLVHVSAVRPDGRARADLRDSDRVYPGDQDRLDTLGQVRALVAGGFDGAISIELFAPEAMNTPDPAGAIRTALEKLREALA